MLGRIVLHRIRQAVNEQAQLENYKKLAYADSLTGLFMSADDIKKLVDKTVISVSAKESLGIDELSDTIKDMFFDGQVSFNDEIYITNIRHKKLLSDAKESLKLVMNSIDDDMPEDFYSIDLMSAYESLGLIIGESVEDDLMDEIFSKFCMGK